MSRRVLVRVPRGVRVVLHTSRVSSFNHLSRELPILYRWVHPLGAASQPLVVKWLAVTPYLHEVSMNAMAWWN